MSRLQQQLQTLPPATLAILSLLGGVYVLQILLDWNVRLFTFCPAKIIEQHQVWRLVTSTVLHGSVLHIGMNFMSAWGLCTTLERTMGTVPLVFTTVASIVLSPVLHLLLAVVPHVVLGYEPWFQEHSLGFSGVLFHYAAIEAASIHGITQSRSVFGLFTVSNTLYPWALLVVLQVLLPNLSFLGHLSGLLTGTLQTQYSARVAWCCHNGVLEQSWSACRNFVPATHTDRTNQDLPITTCRQAGAMACVYMGYIVETIQVILCGRTREDLNNDTTATNSLTMPFPMESEYGDDWIGLPLSADSGDLVESRMT
jgi:membrane associated rhomboid family serine protease